MYPRRVTAEEDFPGIFTENNGGIPDFTIGGDPPVSLLIEGRIGFAHSIWNGSRFFDDGCRYDKGIAYPGLPGRVVIPGFPVNETSE
jgi:hypothetical protein